MYKSEDLDIHITSVESITCDECGETIEDYMIDTEALFIMGWKATRGNRVYCPVCAKKRLRN